MFKKMLCFCVLIISVFLVVNDSAVAGKGDQTSKVYTREPKSKEFVSQEKYLEAWSLWRQRRDHINAQARLVREELNAVCFKLAQVKESRQKKRKATAKFVASSGAGSEKRESAPAVIEQADRTEDTTEDTIAYPFRSDGLLYSEVVDGATSSTSAAYSYPHAEYGVNPFDGSLGAASSHDLIYSFPAGKSALIEGDFHGQNAQQSYYSSLSGAFVGHGLFDHLESPSQFWTYNGSDLRADLSLGGSDSRQKEALASSACLSFFTGALSRNGLALDPLMSGVGISCLEHIEDRFGCASNPAVIQGVDHSTLTGDFRSDEVNPSLSLGVGGSVSSSSALPSVEVGGGADNSLNLLPENFEFDPNEFLASQEK